MWMMQLALETVVEKFQSDAESHLPMMSRAEEVWLMVETQRQVEKAYFLYLVKQYLIFFKKGKQNVFSLRYSARLYRCLWVLP